MILRPYKPSDADIIAEWIKDEDVFLKWGGQYIGEYPLSADDINNKYIMDNGGCEEKDNFYPWVAVDDNRVIGSFIMRYTGGDPKQLRFGWVIVDSSIRGKGYGKQMLSLGIKYAFDFLDANRITIGVFENNELAHNCYKRVGFADTHIEESKPWNVVEMELNKLAEAN